MTGRQPPPPPAYYEKVPEERDSFEALPLLESGPSLLGPLAPTTTSPTSRAVPEEEQQQEQETYPPPEPLPWSPGEVRHHVTYRLRPLPSQAHLAADCAGVLGRSHEVRPLCTSCLALVVVVCGRPVAYGDRPPLKVCQEASLAEHPSPRHPPSIAACSAAAGDDWHGPSGFPDRPPSDPNAAHPPLPPLLTHALLLAAAARLASGHHRRHR